MTCPLGNLQPSQFHAVEGEVRQIPQDRLIRGGEAVMWPRIDETQCADGVARRCDERDPGVEANIWRSNNQRIVAKAWVEGGIEDNESVALRDGMGAERDLPVRLTQVKADLGVKDLPAAVDQ
ncbi:hypothetical protein JCM16408A_24580 [Methylobacterium phyllosphaerae]